MKEDLSDRVPVMFNGYQVGWATPGEDGKVDIALYGQDEAPEFYATSKLRENILEGLSIGED